MKLALLYVEAEIDRVSAADCHSSYMRRITVGTRLCPNEFAFEVGDLLNISSPFTIQYGEGVPVRHQLGFSLSISSEVNVSGSISPFMHSMFAGLENNFGVFTVFLKGARLHIQRISKPRLNFHYLNIEAQGLRNLGADIGGLLGLDDHANQREFKYMCEQQAQANDAATNVDAGSYFHATL